MRIPLDDLEVVKGKILDLFTSDYKRTKLLIATEKNPSEIKR